VFHFDDNVCYGKNAAEYNHLWRDKAWHEYNTTHPFHYMVKVAEARDWIINRVIHDSYQNDGCEKPDNYFVYDISIAACIIADGYYLLRFNDRRFYFVNEAGAVHRRFAAPEPQSSIWWQCHYLKQLKVLMGLIPRSKNVLDKAYVSA
jgi:hypothetical protein